MLVLLADEARSSLVDDLSFLLGDDVDEGDWVQAEPPNVLVTRLVSIHRIRPAGDRRVWIWSRLQSIEWWVLLAGERDVDFDMGVDDLAGGGRLATIWQFTRRGLLLVSDVDGDADIWTSSYFCAGETESTIIIKKIN